MHPTADSSLDLRKQPHQSQNLLLLVVSVACYQRLDAPSMSLVDLLMHKMVLAEALPEDKKLGHRGWMYAAIQLELPCLVVHLVMMTLMETLELVKLVHL